MTHQEAEKAQDQEAETDRKVERARAWLFKGGWCRACGHMELAHERLPFPDSVVWMCDNECNVGFCKSLVVISPEHHAATEPAHPLQVGPHAASPTIPLDTERVAADQERITGLTRQQIAALVDPPAGDARL